jgi:hypothetical protein
VSNFKPKRVSGLDLTAQLADTTAHLPAAAPAPPVLQPSSPSPTGARPPRKVQINFQASEAFAELVAREAEKAGSTRRFFARLLRQAGYDVPEADVNPPDTRRWRGGEATRDSGVG